LVVHPEAS